MLDRLKWRDGFCFLGEAASDHTLAMVGDIEHDGRNHGAIQQIINNILLRTLAFHYKQPAFIPEFKALNLRREHRSVMVCNVTLC